MIGSLILAKRVAFVSLFKDDLLQITELFQNGDLLDIR